MSYFSPRASWMSLVAAPGSFSYTPEPGASIPSLDAAMSRLNEDWLAEEPDRGEEIPSDLGILQNQRDLRHRLFFIHHEWEFGSALFEDNIKLARAQSDPQEAIVFYEEARLVAKTLAENYGEAAFVPAWLQVNRLLAEIHGLLDQAEKTVFYAREGLQAMKSSRFDSSLDPFITKIAVRFWDLLGRTPV